MLYILGGSVGLARWLYISISISVTFEYVSFPIGTSALAGYMCILLILESYAV